MTAVRAKLFTISTREFAQTIVQPALHVAVDNTRAPIKEIAKAANCNYETAKNWYGARAVPGVVHWERLKARLPGFAAEVRRLQALDADHDPEAQRLAAQLVQHIMKARP